jgi:hypothetical protein
MDPADGAIQPQHWTRIAYAGVDVEKPAHLESGGRGAREGKRDTYNNSTKTASKLSSTVVSSVRHILAYCQLSGTVCEPQLTSVQASHV